MKSNLLVYTGGDLETNGYLLPSRGGVLAFDAPPGFADEIDRQKLQVEALLLTHGHFDHIGDAAEIKKRHGCPVYIHPLDASMLTDTSIFRVFGIYPDLPPVQDYQPFQIPAKGTTTWNCGGHDFTLFHVPGHSLGSVVFYEKSLDLVIGGDVLFAGGIGRWDLPGGSQSDLVSGIKKHLWPLPDKTKVCAGHGPATTIGREKLSNGYLQ